MIYSATSHTCLPADSGREDAAEAVGIDAAAEIGVHPAAVTVAPPEPAGADAVATGIENTAVPA